MNFCESVQFIQSKMDSVMLKLWLSLLIQAVIRDVKPLLAAAVEVKYSQGFIIGVQERGFNRPFFSFKGIPFARPPVAELRFKSPMGGVTWKGKRDGSWEPPKCPQMRESNLIGSEDCLYLNVFTPKVGHVGYPVMVYIHGGDFLTGGADDLSPLPLLTRDIVLVVLQYRLGVLGFLSTEDEVLPGNLGLKDQTMALRWVQQNIKEFGGDPSRVTIFGSGSGGASVHFQILTPYAAGLFSRAIIQSGSSLCPRMLRKHHAFLATELFQKLSCDDTDASESPYSSRLVWCLVNTPAEKIATIYTEFLEWQSLPLLNVPRVDGDYIPDHPAVLMKEGRYNKVDLIIGFNKDEGSIITAPLYHYPVLMKAFRDDFLRVGSLTMSFDEEEKPALLAGISYRSYVRGKGPYDPEGANRLTKLFTDRLFGVCINDMLNLLIDSLDEGKRIYSYQLTHRGESELCNSIHTHLDDHWVCHGDDVHYLFDAAHSFTLLEKDDDLILRNIMVTLWTNFATYGHPTPDMSLGFLWEAYTALNNKYLELKPKPSLMKRAYNKTLLFWHSLSLDVNKYLFPQEVGLNVDLEEEIKEDLDDTDEPVFKTTLMDKNSLLKEEERPLSLANSFLERSQHIDYSVDYLDLVAVAHVMSIEDLIAAAGLWSVDSIPLYTLQRETKIPHALSQTEENEQCPGNVSPPKKNLYRDSVDDDYAQVCQKPQKPDPLHKMTDTQKFKTDTTDTVLQNDETESPSSSMVSDWESNEVEDLNLYNLIQAGLLNANLLLKGQEGEEDSLYAVDKDNLGDIIKTQGDYVKQQLEEMKISPDHLQQILEQRRHLAKQHKALSLEEHYGKVLLNKPIVVPDKSSSKKKLNYGDVNSLIQEKPKSTAPLLSPSGDK